MKRRTSSWKDNRRNYLRQELAISFTLAVIADVSRIFRRSCEVSIDHIVGASVTVGILLRVLEGRICQCYSGKLDDSNDIAGSGGCDLGIRTI